MYNYTTNNWYTNVHLFREIVFWCIVFISKTNIGYTELRLFRLLTCKWVYNYVFRIELLELGLEFYWCCNIFNQFIFPPKKNCSTKKIDVIVVLKFSLLDISFKLFIVEFYFSNSKKYLLSIADNAILLQISCKNISNKNSIQSVELYYMSLVKCCCFFVCWLF